MLQGIAEQRDAACAGGYPHTWVLVVSYRTKEQPLRGMLLMRALISHKTVVQQKWCELLAMHCEHNEASLPHGALPRLHVGCYRSDIIGIIGGCFCHLY